MDRLLKASNLGIRISRALETTDPIEGVRKLEGSIELIDIDSDCDLIIKKSASRFVFFVGELESFVIAMCLGHLFLHMEYLVDADLIYKGSVFHRYGYYTERREARAFAYSFMNLPYNYFA